MFQTNEHLEALSAEDRTALEQVVERFEAAWSRGERPDLAACLPAGGPLRQAILVELACADLEYRLKAGEPARAEAYLTRFPELAADRPAVLGLASLEFAVRRRSEPGL
ncbi:MAG TPA: hypothetical protein VFA26_03420, partial [Gemmataceae bacterium]|nr:hypothetical protein [Gemmataceae bacterium]